MGKKGSLHYNGARLGPRHKQPGSNRYHCKDIVYNTLATRETMQKTASRLARLVGRNICRQKRMPLLKAAVRGEEISSVGRYPLIS